jgi:predicted O-methyltransferase YrrM
MALTNRLGALTTTVGENGIMINGDPNTEEWQNACLLELYKLIDTPEIKNKYIENNWLKAKETTWEKRAKEMLEKYLNKMELEYKFMGNWTLDIPAGTKREFENVLDLFNKTHTSPSSILEIGTYTGTSLIHIVRKIKNIGEIFVIDCWENYKEENTDITNNIRELKVEQSFYKNIKTMKNEVNVYKGKSVNMLYRLIDEKKMMDLIYIDGSHNEYDFMFDVILSWKILNKGGYLILDDVYSNIKLVNGLNHFIKENAVKILWENYRVFLEKCQD